MSLLNTIQVAPESRSVIIDIGGKCSKKACFKVISIIKEI